MESPCCIDKQRMLTYLQGSVSDAEAESVEAHLATCEACERTFQSLDNLDDTLRSVFRDSEIAPENFSAENEFRRAVLALKQVADGPAFGGDFRQAWSAGMNRPVQDGAGHPTAVPYVLPHTLGEYQLLERLGSGGMGTVYKARHLRLNRVVAVKMLDDSKLYNGDATTRFDREVMAVGGLDHPNIVRATDAREVDGQRLLVMEFVQGIDLSALVRRVGPLPIGDACELVRQAALGLQSAHLKGFVHRDVKPSNLMLATSGQVKVLDLGLALFQDQACSLDEVTALGQALGTAEYIAPEQISDSHKVDSRTDIYSLGCTLFRLLSGRAPFDGPQYATRIEKLSAHLRLAVPDIRGLRLKVPPELAEILGRMTANSSAARMSSMAEVAEALASLGLAHDLPSLLKRAALGREPSTPEALTDGLCASSQISTGLSRQPKTIGQPTDASGDSGASRGRRRVIELAAVATPVVLAVALAAFLAIRWRDSTDREATNVSIESSRLARNKEATVSAEPPPSKENEKSGPTEMPTADPVALQDFFKDVPGRWVPVLTSEKDLADCQIFKGQIYCWSKPVLDGVRIQSGVVEITDRVVRLSSFKSAIQGIRAKVKWDGDDIAGLFVRDGLDGYWVTCFYPIGDMNFGVICRGGEKDVWESLSVDRAPANPLGVFTPIGMAAMGDTLAYEAMGRRIVKKDHRVVFGMPAIGMPHKGHAFFKEIEVFVPEEDVSSGNLLSTKSSH